MSVATGIPPAALLALDAEMFDAIEDEAGRRWDADTELAAQALEVTHDLYRAFVEVHSKPRAPIPPRLHVPRPDDLDPPIPEAPRPVSVNELVALTGVAVVPAEGD